MSIFKCAHALRAAVLACGLVIAGGAAEVKALSPMSPAMVGIMARTAEPFRPFTSILPDNELSQKWRGVQRQIDDELLVLALCDEDRARCTSPAALRFLDIVADAKAYDGRARLGQINRALNLAIHPASDLAQFGTMDVWQAPLEMLTRGAGDCEDYAIAKFVALRAAGVPAADLRIVILRDTLRQQDHAVTAARLDGNWLLLDNRRMAMVEDHNAEHVAPLFVIDSAGVRQYRNVPIARDIPAGV